MKTIVITFLFFLVSNLYSQNFLYNQFKSVGIPISSDLQSNFGLRSGSYLIDTISQDTATILLPAFTNTNSSRMQGDVTRASELLFDGNDYTLYFRLQQVDSVNVGVSTLDILSFGTSGRYLRWYFFFQNVRLRYSDGTTTYTHNVYSINNGLLNYDYVDVIVNISASTDNLSSYIYDPEGSLLGNSSQDISAFNFNNNTNSRALYFECKESGIFNFKKFSDIKTLSECLDHTDTTDAQLFYPDIISGTNIIADSNHLDRVNVDYNDVIYSSASSYILDYGFNDYQYGIDDDVEPHLYIPYLYDGTFIDPDFSQAGVYVSGSRIVGERPSSNGINARDFKLRFKNSFFDRTDATIWNSQCRASQYYDVTDSTTFHSSELNQRTLYEWLNDGYKGRLYVHMTDNSIEFWDRHVLTNIYLYQSDHKSIENAEILAYTGDDLARVGNGYDINNYVELGYLQTDSAMFTIRIDDGDRSALDEWLPVFDTSGIDAIVGVHWGETGTVGTYDYLSASELQVLVDSGWSIADHNYFEQDFNSTDHLDSIEIQMNLAIQAGLDSLNKIILDNIGNRHSSANPSVEYYSHKVGYRSHIAWGPYNRPDSANFKIINPYRLSGLAADLAGRFYLDDVDNSQEIAALKAEVDKCAAEGRWMIVFVHTFSQKVSDGLAEVIQYAIDNNVGLVSFDYAMSQIKYLSK